MGDGLANAPDWVLELQAVLRDADFEQLDEHRFNESFGNYYATFARGNTRIRPVLDRGHWNVDLWDARKPTNQFGQPRAASSLSRLRVAEGLTDESRVSYADPEHEARWLMSHLQLASELVADSATWVALDDLGRQYARRVLGIELSPRADP
jgi:hypothetical protein